MILDKWEERIQDGMCLSDRCFHLVQLDENARKQRGYDDGGCGNAEDFCLADNLDSAPVRVEEVTLKEMDHRQFPAIRYPAASASAALLNATRFCDCSLDSLAAWVSTKINL